MRYLILIFCHFTLISVSSFAQSASFKKVENADRITKILFETSNKVQTVKSDFEQEKNSSALANKVVSSGKLYYKKPAMVKMDYKKPYAYLIVLNNGNVLIKDSKDAKQFNSNSSKIFKQVNELIIQSVDGSIAQNKDYKVDYQESDKYILLTLDPVKKRLKSFVNSIEVYFDKKDYSVHKFVLNEASGDNLTIRFFNKELNAKIEDGEFSDKQ